MVTPTTKVLALNATSVVYSYTDSYGNLYIPYYSGSQSYLNTLVEVLGSHGACPV